MSNADLAVCTWSGYDSDGFLGVQCGSLAKGNNSITPFHYLSPGGLHHRPLDPKGEVGATALRWFDTIEGWAFVLGDVRTDAALPNLPKGATLLHDTGQSGGDPFVGTVLLDPEAKKIEVEAHRAGVKIALKNAEGLTVEMNGTTLKITGATSVELGDGASPLALASLVSAQLTALLAAIGTAASTEKAASGMGGMSALQGLLSAWPQPVAATIAKGA